MITWDIGEWMEVEGGEEEEEVVVVVESSEDDFVEA
jgi:hypothetical protein